MINGFYISRFRNFGEEDQYVGPLSKINVFIGSNNSGKSNILRFVRDILIPLFDVDRGRARHAVPSVSTPRFPINNSTIRWVLVPSDQATVESYLHGQVQVASWYDWFKSHPLSVDEGKFFKLPVSRNDNRLSVFDKLVPMEGINEHIANRIWSPLTNRTGGSFQAWHLGILNTLLERSPRPPQCSYIPAFRNIETRIEEFKDEYKFADDSIHIIDELAELAYPPYDQQAKKQRFERLRNFIADVIEHPDLSIEIPHDRKTINLDFDGNVIPLEAAGSGIHELFMLAARVVLNESGLTLLEEPEVHMHPKLQRKFMSFLATEGRGQFFITTHSAHVIDTPGAAIFGVRSVDGRARVEQILTDQSRRAMCEELGYRPSDLLQTNCVIWVEGPSDRIYINAWLGAVAPDLREGIDYSVMFYGGKLLSHLSVLDESLKDFIGLLPLNRNPAVVIDSDLGSDQQNLRETKIRIQREIDSVSGFCWITAGREMENYIPASARLSAIKAAHPKAVRLASTLNKFAKPLDFVDTAGGRVTKGFDKVKIAKIYARSEIDLDMLDLEARVKSLVSYIRRANGQLVELGET